MLIILTRFPVGSDIAEQWKSNSRSVVAWLHMLLKYVDANELLVRSEMKASQAANQCSANES